MSKARIAKWDNLKIFMMLCVVIGHVLYEFISKENLEAKAIYVFIYTFHMPVFIFVSGVFSKNAVKNMRYENIIEYLTIYVFMKVLDNFGACLAQGTTEASFPTRQFFYGGVEGLFKGKTSFHFLWENGPGWFALAMAVYLFITMLIKNYDKKYMLLIAIFIGCVAGLDDHFGDHFASMRICVFYPIYLAGYYTDYTAYEGLKKDRKYLLMKVLAFMILLACFLTCFRYADTLYSMVNFLKGKCDYYSLELGFWGVICRLMCYGMWEVLIFSIIILCPEKKRSWTWLGQRTMAIFIWHKLLVVLIFKVFEGELYLKTELPHTYNIAAICIACIITIVTAYFPDFRISRKLVRKKVENCKE